jgi:hypothetical protein
MIRAAASGTLKMAFCISYRASSGGVYPLHWCNDRKQFQISFRVLLNPPISSVDAMKLNTR